MQPNELLISAAIDMQSEPAGKKNGYWQESVTIRFRQSPRIDKKEIIPALQGTPDEQESVVEVAANRTQTANKQKSE